MIEANELEYWAALGKLDQVARALAARPDVNIRGYNGYTAMHAAAENGHNDVVRFLVERGADLSPRVESGETPLNLAERSDHIETVELLKSLGASC